MKNSPHLVNISSDPSLSGVLLYLIPSGDVLVGKSPECHIRITGSLIESVHCQISNEDFGPISIQPIAGETYLNGRKIEETVVLSNGDRLVFGGTHYFAFRSGNGQNMALNFDVATEELFENQKAHLERHYRELQEKQRQESQAEIRRIREEMENALQEGPQSREVRPLDESLVHVIDQMEEYLNADQSKNSLGLNVTHFEMDRLVKEANQAAAARNRNLMFEISVTAGVGEHVKVTRDDHWVTTWTGQAFRQNLRAMQEAVEEDMDASWTAMVLQFSQDWVPVSSDGNATTNSDKIRSRKRLSKRVSQLAIRSGLEASLLEPPPLETSDIESRTTVCAALLSMETDERPKSDAIYQSLRALEVLYGLLESAQLDPLQLTHHMLALKYATQFGLESDVFNRPELRSKVRKTFF